MNELLSWQPEYTEPVIGIMMATIVFVIYFYFFKASILYPKLAGKNDSEIAQENSVHMQRIAGLVLFGIIPAITILVFFPKSISEYGVNFKNIGTSLLYAVILLIIVIPTLFFTAKKTEHQKLYPQIRKKDWTNKDLIKSAFSWYSYMLGYEFLFRGFLLYILAYSLGGWLAIIISTSLYVLAHLDKNANETIGCIPIGIIFAYISLSTGSFFGPFLIHSIIGNMTEYFSLKANPEMQIVKK